MVVVVWAQPVAADGGVPGGSAGSDCGDGVVGLGEVGSGVAVGSVAGHFLFHYYVVSVGIDSRVVSSIVVVFDMSGCVIWQVTSGEADVDVWRLGWAGWKGLTRKESRTDGQPLYICRTRARKGKTNKIPPSYPIPISLVSKAL